MSFTTGELLAGIRYWRTTQWPRDFHNQYYQQKLMPMNPRGVFNDEWWQQFLPVLVDWSATRPKRHDQLTERARSRFQRLTEAWSTFVAPHLNEDIAVVDWSHVHAFPGVVGEVKAVRSPVFTSKFCHFLAPAIFPVVDNRAMGNPFSSYADYYQTARQEWLGTDSTTQDELVTKLTEAIGPSPPFDAYPMKCKLIELCLIGRRNP